MERFNPTPEVQNDILETASEKSEASTFAEGLSERLCSEQFLEQIKQFPSRERQTALGIAIEYNILHRDGFGFEESMNMLLEESAKVKTFDTIGRKEDVSATLYITSTAKKLGLVEPFSEDDEKAIFEFIAQNIYREGFAYHAFNGCFKKSILENGLNSSVVPWDQAELDDVAAIGKEYGHPMILGWHKIQEEKSVYFDIHPYSVYRYGIASPEWFAQFVAEGFHVPVEGNKKKAFYLRDYEMAKANIENLCTEMTSRRREDIDAGKAYSNISNEDTQYIEILKILEHLPVEIYKVDYLEADDLIQYFVAKNKGEGVIQYIASTDQDYLQCIEKDVYVWNPQTKLLLDSRKVEENFGFLSENFIWYKIIKGDDSDEIPGVNGIALKTMLKVFPEIQQQKIDSLQDLLYLIENKEGKGVALHNLKNSAAILTRNYQLMRLSESNINYKKVEEIENQNKMQSEIKFEPGLLDIHLIRKGFYIYFKDFSYIKKIFLLVDTKQKLKV